MLSLPKHNGRGRPSKLRLEKYRQDLILFAETIKDLKKKMDIEVSSRGWAYILETERLINKDQFQEAQELINDCRTEGLLPVDIAIDDKNRTIYNVKWFYDNANPAKYLESCIRSIEYEVNNYTPINFWDGEQYELFLSVEKGDLLSLFRSLSYKYHIAFVNFKGWSDINSRRKLIELFKRAEAQERTPVLLYCGDHDPDGLRISSNLHKNFDSLVNVTGWLSDNLIIDRFGLNKDFIDRHNITWIDNLMSGGGKDLTKPKKGKTKIDKYIAEYIDEFGVRKCEANALVTRPNEARELFEATINKYVSQDHVLHYQRMLIEARQPLSELYEEFKAKLTELKDEDGDDFYD